MPVVEISSFKLLAAVANNNELHPSLDAISKGQGSLSTSWGIQSEDKETVYIVQKWETSEHDNNVKAALTPSLVENFDVLNVEFSPSADDAFSAPCTEIATFLIKAESSKEELFALLKKLSDSLSGAQGIRSAVSYGLTKENSMILKLTIGWDSVEAHWAAVKDDPPAGIINNLRDYADLSLIHVCLAKYPS